MLLFSPFFLVLALFQIFYDTHCHYVIVRILDFSLPVLFLYLIFVCLLNDYGMVVTIHDKIDRELDSSISFIGKVLKVADALSSCTCLNFLGYLGFFIFLVANFVILPFTG